MKEITIDNKKIVVNNEKTVLECALNNGIYIPHLCYHKDLGSIESCRLCIVEVEGKDKPVPSCKLKIEDGMKITTKSPEIDRLRMLAMELLLTNHPEDCSTCPKYGKCELQTLIQYIGPKTGRMKMRTRGLPPVEENPLIVHDMNRCVLCGRCVRACEKLRGVGILKYIKNENETHIGIENKLSLKDADCRFCGACVEVCPTGSIRDKLQENITNREMIVPCRLKCPAHTDVPRYIRFVKNGDYDAAAAVIREKVPFPKVLGYICNHLCEFDCKRKEVNEAMSIRNIKRYAAEHDTGSYWKGKGKQLPDTGKKVCVIGAGPAGLSAAYYLRKQGHKVTVKEKMADFGGMMTYGIPAYRLPYEIIKEEVQVIIDQGVQIEFNTEVKDAKALLNEYDAVLVALGGDKGIKLPLKGKDLKGVLVNTEFLKNTQLKKETGLGKKVIVLGGGNVAFDCARTAVRAGAEEVHLACLESRETMTADDIEINEAIEEGIKVHPAQTFEQITGTDRVTGVDFMNVKNFYFDENKKPVIEKEENSEHHIEADTVIFAVGQIPDIDEDFNLEIDRRNRIIVKDIDNDKSTSVEGVFAAGDVIYGTNSVIKAIESGREAASQIDMYLGGDGDISEVLAPIEEVSGKIGKKEGFGYEERKESEVLSVEKRIDNFNLVDHGICEKDIKCEAGRCLQCDLRLKISEPVLWGDLVSDDSISKEADE